MAKIDTILLAVTQDYSVQIGLPPQHHQDNFSSRAAFLGKVDNVSHVACSPAGELFCIRSGDLYRGPMPSKQDVDWFTVAQRVGRFDWSKIKLIFFHPNGDLYCTTHKGDFYKGPPPDNEHVPWLYCQATKIGRGNWNVFIAFSFDPDGNLFGVDNESFYTGPPPTDENVAWKKLMIGGDYWKSMTHFMAFTNDKQFWSVDVPKGTLYRGDSPRLQPWYWMFADILGWGYNNYRFLSFTKDKTIHKIISFEFLIDEGKKVSESPQVLEEKLYDNRKSNTTMKHEYKINKTVRESSSFSRDHGFTFDVGIETTVKTGIPVVAEGQVTVTMSMSTTHNWNFTEMNETETSFESNTIIELEPGNAIRVVSSVMKAEIDVPYKAIARTLFGSEVEIRGMWKGVSHYNLIVKQEDYDK
ncbi:tachylectin-2-like [Dendropsophus ebraccatus]|uniref:tachylectin-2-like n=1 Tax=Dendropsophus ebraccatus TaxID=150705 RepID=UPI003831BB4F